MLYSISTVCLSGTLRQKIAAVAAAGFRGIEIFENDLILHDGSVRDVRNLIEDHGLSVVTYQPFRDFEGMPASHRARTFDRAEAKLDLTQELGCDLLMVCSNASPLSLGGLNRAVDDFIELGDRAAKRGMRVAYEALSWGNHVFDYRDAWEVVRRANHPNVGLTLDTFHIFSRGLDSKAIPQIPGDRIFLVQVADAPLLSMDHLSWSRNYRCYPGQGDFPLRDFMDAVAMTGYDGPLSLEIFSDLFRSRSELASARDGYRSLIYLGCRAEDAARSELPPVTPPQSVAFLEFAVTDDEAAQLAKLLVALGFVQTGRHRTKAVDLYVQGPIHLVINRQSGGFADEYRALHGPSVCAVGLMVPNAAQVARRSDLLDYPTQVLEPHGMPSIPNSGGSLLYLVDPDTMPAIWQREFEGIDRLGKPLLSRIDLVSFTKSYPEIMSAVLQYRAVFGMESTTPMVVADQGWVVKSQMMKTPDQAVRIGLTSLASQGVVTNPVSGAVEQPGGMGVQHIAFETDDIFAVAQALVQSGVQPLTVPENYYPDLAARLNLPPEILTRMQTHGILYDEDQNGRMYHFFAKPQGLRVTIEVVQRQDGYRGAGLPNVPVRMAMQRAVLSDPTA